LVVKSVEFYVARKCSGILRPNATRLVLFPVAAVILTPSIANANPVMLNPSSALAFCVVAFWAMVVEAGVVALLLAFRGAAALPMFGGYFVLNSVVFLFLFQPLLTGNRSLPVPVLEAMVVLVDAVSIKLLVALAPFQGDGFRGVSWLRSVLISGVGNGLSYLVGYIATRRPWEMAS
jgi:hypothetical protein